MLVLLEVILDRACLVSRVSLSGLKCLAPDGFTLCLLPKVAMEDSACRVSR